MIRRGVDAPPRALVVCLLLIAATVFFFGEVLLVRTYRMVDGSPGLSLEDVRLAFTENSHSLLEARLRTDMREHVDEAELATLFAWVRSGGPRDDYDQSVAGVFEDRCLRCHKQGGAASFRPLETYDEVRQALADPPCPPFRSMVTITKIHLVGLGALLAIPVLVRPGSSRGARRQSMLVWVTYAGLALDFGSWWLMRIDLAFAIGRAVGHTLLVGGFVWLSVEALRELWLRGRHGD